MSKKSVVTVAGGARLRRTLARAGVELTELAAVHRRVAAIVARRSQSRVPRDSGALAGTLRSSGTKTQAVVRAGYKSVPYANPIHWGWPAHSIAPSRFIIDPARESESSWIAQYRAAVNKAIAKVKGV